MENNGIDNAVVLVGYPRHYKITTARNHFAPVSNARASTEIDAAIQVVAMEIIRANFGDCEIVDKAVS